jgi:apolipoprotein D and lipocalin family protein
MRNLAILLLVVVAVSGHRFKSGECPTVEPQQGFDMRKFLGIWYAVQKTTTASSCVIYNITTGDEPGEYLIQQVSQNFLLGLAPLKHKYSYTGVLEKTDEEVPAKMKVKFPLSVAGSAKFIVFMTDYENYAGIFTCQKLPVGNRHSATILSRTKELEKAYIDKIRNRLSSFQINPFDLSIVSQKDCPKVNEDGGFNISIDPDTFSAKNIGSWVRKAGEKIGDGVETVISGGKSIYNKWRGDSNESGETARLVDTSTPHSWMP